MAQTGYTPLLIYGSTTAGNTPDAANMTTSASGVELAINAYDGKLFYKDASGNVQVLAGKGGTGVVAGSNTQVQFNNNGVFGASANLTWDGSTLSTTGFTASGTVTFSGGTANGVAYLNGSKVLTTGSALTFDGTNLGIGTSSPAAKLHVYGSGQIGIIESSGNYGTSGSGYLRWKDVNGNAGYVGFGGNANNFDIYNSLNGAVTFSTNATEQMRLTSTGLGIGTSSPANKLSVYGANGSTTVGAQLKISNTTGSAGATRLSFAVDDANNKVWFVSGGSVVNPSFNWATNDGGTAQMTLDASGNLGLGVTPSAWNSARKAIQLPSFSLNSYSTTDADIVQNGYVTSGGGYAYVNAGYASLYSTGSGAHKWFTAPSGTAGNAITFTQAMTLDASGNLLVGTTGGFGGKLNITGYTNGGWYGIVMRPSADSSAPIRFENAAGSEVGSIQTTATATAYTTSSDYRLKNITGPITNSGAYIDSLNPVEGTWKADGSTFVGLIAHEVQEASRTQVATGVKDGEQMQAMDYSNSELIANMIAELKSLRARVAQLEA